jgi:hypothetical protein
MSKDYEMRRRQSESAARDCIRAAKTIESLRSLFDDPDDAYRPCINESLSPLLHLLSDLFQRSAMAQCEEQPWFDFGIEPLNESDGELKLSRFLELAEAMLDGPRPGPFTCAEVRATTFALMLHSPNTTQ